MSALADMVFYFYKKSDDCTKYQGSVMTHVQDAESHVKKCRPIVCPHAGFLAQLQSWYFTLNKQSAEGITESAHDIIELLTLNESEAELNELREVTPAEVNGADEVTTNEADHELQTDS